MAWPPAYFQQQFPVPPPIQPSLQQMLGVTYGPSYYQQGALFPQYTQQALPYGRTQQQGLEALLEAIKNTPSKTTNMPGLNPAQLAANTRNEVRRQLIQGTFGQTDQTLFPEEFQGPGGPTAPWVPQSRTPFNTMDPLSGGEYGAPPIMPTMDTRGQVYPSITEWVPPNAAEIASPITPNPGIPNALPYDWAAESRLPELYRGGLPTARPMSTGYQGLAGPGQGRPIPGMAWEPGQQWATGGPAGVDMYREPEMIDYLTRGQYGPGGVHMSVDEMRGLGNASTINPEAAGWWGKLGGSGGLARALSVGAPMAGALASQFGPGLINQYAPGSQDQKDIMGNAVAGAGLGAQGFMFGPEVGVPTTLIGAGLGLGKGVLESLLG